MEESDNQKFCLKWNNFQNNFMSQFETLKEDEDFVDVTLSCYGQSIKAHKVVLSACSPYLKSIFKVRDLTESDANSGCGCSLLMYYYSLFTFRNIHASIQ